MAPEQARCESIDERSDIFGVGAVLAEIVSGCHPYGEGTTDLVVAASRGAVVPLDPRKLKVPARLCSIVNRATAALPADRYQNVERLNEDIRQFLLGGFDFPRIEVLAGDVIVLEGETGSAAYMILSGTCRALVHKNGRELVLRTMGEGEIFGELALLLDEPRSATVVAESNTKLMVIEKSAIEAHGVLDGWSSVLLKALARRFQQLDDELRSYK
jgi:serine/threonine-protein kinase